MSHQQTQYSPAGARIFATFAFLMIFGLLYFGPVKGPLETNCLQPVQTVSGMTIYASLMGINNQKDPQIVDSELKRAANAFADLHHTVVDQTLPSMTLVICRSPDNTQITSIRTI